MLNYHTPVYDDFVKSKLAAQAENKNGQVESALALAAKAAQIAWMHLPGCFADGELEDLVAELGRQALAGEVAARPAGAGRHKRADILCLTSMIMDAGGHSSLIKHWLRLLDASGYHMAFASTELMASTAISSAAAIIDSTEKMFFLSAALPLFFRIRQLKALIEAVDPKVILLVLHPHDVIALAVLRNLPKRCPVVFINHADHTFWLGRSASDVVVDYRPTGAHYTRAYRGASKGAIIPLLCEVPNLPADPAEARASRRRQLGVPPAATLSLTVTNLYKILGSAWSYLDSLVELLRRNQGHHHLLIISHGGEPIRRYLLESGVQDRFHVLETQPHAILGSYYSAADFLIESFPYNGGTVRHEAMLMSLPVVVVNNPLEPQNTELQGLPENYPVASSQAELLAQAEAFINSDGRRADLGRVLRAYYQEKFSEGVVAEKIKRLIDAVINGNPLEASAPAPAGVRYDFHAMYRQDLLAKAEEALLVGNEAQKTQLFKLWLKGGESLDDWNAVFQKYQPAKPPLPALTSAARQRLLNLSPGSK